MDLLRLPHILVNEILTQASRHPGVEICGFLSGRGDTANRCFPVANVAVDAHCGYEMDAAGQIDAMRGIRQAGDDVVAIYHSHPEGLAAPSRRDVQEASYPDAVYLIVSLGTKGVLEMAAFRIEAGQVRDVALELI